MHEGDATHHVARLGEPVNHQTIHVARLGEPVNHQTIHAVVAVLRTGYFVLGIGLGLNPKPF